MCSVCLLEESVTFALYAFSRLVFITEVESVYRAVRTDSLNVTQIRFVFKGLIQRTIPGEVEVQLQSFLTSALHGGVRLATCTDRSTPRENPSGIQWSTWV
jgi:hypothetical protein